MSPASQGENAKWNGKQKVYLLYLDRHFCTYDKTCIMFNAYYSIRLSYNL